jgi:hypothetical protein
MDCGGTEMIENSSLSNADRKVAGHTASHIFQKPHEILADPGMGLDEKRALLASWASDARAVPSAPSLRQLEDGSRIDVDDILRALKSLDASNGIESSRKQPTTLCLRPLERRRLPASRSWLRILRRRSRDDDDDPPPCPAYAVISPRQGAGGAVACPEHVAA